MKKSIFTIAILLGSMVCVFAQEVVSAAGGTQSVAEYEVSWTLGESVIETGSSGNHLLTQGFHQSLLTVTSTEIFANDLNINVYPNPAQEFVLINSDQLLGNAEYALFSLTGEKLMEGKITSRTTKLNLENSASGTYILKLSGENSRPLQTFKIVKR